MSFFVVSSISEKSFFTDVVFPVPGSPRQTVFSGRVPARPGLTWKASSFTWSSRCWNCSGTKSSSKTSGSRNRVSSHMRRLFFIPLETVPGAT